MIYYMKHFFTKWNIINFILMACAYGFGLYALVAVKLFTSVETRNDDMSVLFFSIIVVCFFISLLTFILLNAWLRKVYKPSLCVGAILITLFLINLIALLSFKAESTIRVDSENSFAFSLTDFDRIKYIIQYFIMLSLVFLTFDAAPKIFKDTNVLLVACYMCITVVLICVIYSYWTETETYFNFVKNIGKGNSYTYVVQSWLIHRNSYGICLFMGITASLYIHFLTKRWPFLVAALFFYINIIFTLCKTALILGFVLLVFYLLVRFFLTFKENKKRNIIAISIIGGIIVIFGVTVLTILICKNRIEYLFESLFGTTHFSTIISRFGIWKDIFKMFEQFNIVTGVGYHLFGRILIIFNTMSISEETCYAHNGFLELLGNGGIFLVIAYVLSLVYVVIRYFQVYKEDKMLSIFGLGLISTMLVYTMVESGTLLFCSTLEYTFFSFLVFVPILQRYPFNPFKKAVVLE